METYFENVGRADMRAIVEMRYRLNAKRIWIWVGIYLLMGAYFLRQYVLGDSYLIMPLLCVLAAVYMATMPYLNVRRGFKKEVAFYNGTLPESTVKIGDKIEICDVDSSRTWEYHHLTEVHSFKYSYCLRFADRTVLLFNRSDFTKGTFEEFKQFLRTKRPDLKIPE